MDLQQKFQKHIDDNFPFLKNKKLLIAASGGIDSAVCIHLLRNLNFKISLIKQYSKCQVNWFGV